MQLPINALLLVIDEEITRWMRACDLFSPGKFLIQYIDISFQTTTNVDYDYFMKMINESFKKFKENDEGVRIAAIICMKYLFAHEDVKVISDGKYEMFIPQSSLGR